MEICWMHKMIKVALLSDNNTSKVGITFFDRLEMCMRKNQIESYHIKVRPDVDIAEAVRQFDRISLEIKPEFLIVADFACVRMQSAEEEPMYNNMGLMLVHLLFRRPWEYEIFLNGRCNFTTRYYCVLYEDMEFIKTYYPRLVNPRCFMKNLWEKEERAVCFAEWENYEYLKQQYQLLPDYMKTIAKYWKGIMDKQPLFTEHEGMQQCLKVIGFTCSEKEYLDILYLMRMVFPIYYMEKKGINYFEQPVLNETMLIEQMQEFLERDFKITLLGGKTL